MLDCFKKLVFAQRFFQKNMLVCLAVSASLSLGGCAQVNAPDTRNVNIPSPKFVKERKKAINERPDSVLYLPLGKDVLIPEAISYKPFPKKSVGPFELRGETLGGALQLILDEVDIPIAFETNEGLERPITVTRLQGELETVVSRVCSLADLYCAYEGGILVVKDNQLFAVTIPPIGSDNTFLTNITTALEEIVGETPVSDESTRTIIYRASHRTSEVADAYFQRLRSNTALIIFETYIWEVSLNSGNSTGVDWDSIDTFGKFDAGVSISGSTNPTLGTPISIGLPTTGGVAFDGDNVFQFISEYGAVKTISQPQVTVLAGSSARFRVADTQNFVSEITRSVSEGEVSVSTTTDSVDTGFTFDIASSWDSSTVYGDINILLQEVRTMETFNENPDAIVQLPQTTERELSTQVRIRPGDSLLIAGLVREIDNFSRNGPGIETPFFASSRTAQTSNVELVFLLRPQVIVYTAPTDEAFQKLEEAYRQDLKELNQRNTVDEIIEDLVQDEDTIPLEEGMPSPDSPVSLIEEGIPPLISPIPFMALERSEKPVGTPLLEFSAPPLESENSLTEPQEDLEDSDYVPVNPIF